MTAAVRNTGDIFKGKLLMTNKPTAICRHCGEHFTKLKDGKIPTHDYPKPCRAVCPGAGKSPKDNDDTPLYKDDPQQEATDFMEQARMELRLYGFAVVKEFASLSGRTGGRMQCPLCQQELAFSVASNGHCAARCATKNCINAIE